MLENLCFFIRREYLKLFPRTKGTEMQRKGLRCLANSWVLTLLALGKASSWLDAPATIRVTTGASFGIPA